MAESRENSLCAMKAQNEEVTDNDVLSKQAFKIEEAGLVNSMLALLPEAFTTCSYFSIQRIQIRITRAIPAHQMATAE